MRKVEVKEGVGKGTRGDKRLVRLMKLESWEKCIRKARKRTSRKKDGERVRNRNEGERV